MKKIWFMEHTGNMAKINLVLLGHNGKINHINDVHFFVVILETGAFSIPSNYQLYLEPYFGFNKK